MVKLLARSIFPPRAIVRDAFSTSIVNVLSAVSATDELEAKNRSKAVVVVSRTSNVVNLPVLGVVAPILMLLIVPTPVDVNVNVGSVPEVNITSLSQPGPVAGLTNGESVS